MKHRSAPVVKRDKQGKINPKNFAHVYSDNFTKKCKTTNGGQSCVYTLKHQKYCVLQNTKVVCKDMKHGEKLQVKCTETKPIVGSTHCDLVQTCAYSSQEKGVVCSNTNILSKKLCVSSRCYDMSDVQELGYTASCNGKDKCTIAISRFCLKTGKCYTSHGKSYVVSGKISKCSRVVLTSAAAARLHILCQKNHNKSECKFQIFLETLRTRLGKEVRKSCHIPPHLKQCGSSRTLLQAQKCKGEIDACKIVKTKRKYNECMRHVYIGCVTEVYINRYYCASKGIKPSFSVACLAVGKEDIKCLLVYSKCDQLKSEKLRQECFQKLEMTCGLVASRYIECNSRSLKGGKGGEIGHTNVNCKALVADYSTCNVEMMNCMTAKNNNQVKCMKKYRATCVEKIEKYHKYKYKCSGY